MINNGQYDEKLRFPFENPSTLTDQMKEIWEQTQKSLENINDKQWEEEPVELLINGASFITLPRIHIMWFFLNEIIHHRSIHQFLIIQ